jgi:hypothetical protein
MAIRTDERLPLIFFAILLVFGALVAFAPRATTTAEPTPEGALAACRIVAKQRLKAPATAVFPADHDGVFATRTERDPEHVWETIDAYVDSHNSFGAMTRTHYTCEATWSPEAGRFTAARVEFAQ